MYYSMVLIGCWLSIYFGIVQLFLYGIPNEKNLVVYQS
jgi:hypothetical protein